MLEAGQQVAMATQRSTVVSELDRTANLLSQLGDAASILGQGVTAIAGPVPAGVAEDKSPPPAPALHSRLSSLNDRLEQLVMSVHGDANRLADTLG